MFLTWELTFHNREFRASYNSIDTNIANLIKYFEKVLKNKQEVWLRLI